MDRPLSQLDYGKPLLQTLYRYLFHPDVGLWLGRFLSGRSRKAHHPLDYTDLGERESISTSSSGAAIQKGTAADWYLFAHRHLPMVRQIENVHYIVIGEWIARYTFLEIDGDRWALQRYGGPHSVEVLFSGHFSHAVVGV